MSSLKKADYGLHSPQDVTVGIQNAAEIYQNAMHPKSFVSLDGADHLLSNKEDSTYAGDMIAAWSKRYIKSKERDELTSKHQVFVLNEG